MLHTARKAQHQVAWHYHTDSADFYHFTSSKSADVCEDTSVRMSNAGVYGLPRSLIMCDRFFKPSLLLEEKDTPPSSELGQNDAAAAMLLRELFHVGEYDADEEEFTFEDPCKSGNGALGILSIDMLI